MKFSFVGANDINGLEDGLFIGRQVDLSSFSNIRILCKRLPVKLAVWLILQNNDHNKQMIMATT